MPYDKNNYVRTKKQREQIAKGHAEWKKVFVESYYL